MSKLTKILTYVVLSLACVTFTLSLVDTFMGAFDNTIPEMLAPRIVFLIIFVVFDLALIGLSGYTLIRLIQGKEENISKYLSSLFLVYCVAIFIESLFSSVYLQAITQIAGAPRYYIALEILPILGGLFFALDLCPVEFKFAKYSKIAIFVSLAGITTIKLATLVFPTILGLIATLLEAAFVITYLVLQFGSAISKHCKINKGCENGCCCCCEEESETKEDTAEE